MNFQKRKQIILEKLEQYGQAEIKQLATELDTSEITIRRDMNQLAADGLLQRTHGGAAKIVPFELPHAFVTKAARNMQVKDDLCRVAAGYINDGDIVFMDCGSTVYRLCQFIRNKNIRVITNSIPVVFELQNSAVQLNIIGGEFDAGRQAVHGKIANEHIARYRANKAFLGVDGISPNGLYANSELEADITQAFAAQSAQTFLLCDESKIGKETYLRFAEVSLVDVLITNSTSTELEKLKEQGIVVVNV